MSLQIKKLRPEPVNHVFVLSIIVFLLEIFDLDLKVFYFLLNDVLDDFILVPDFDYLFGGLQIQIEFLDNVLVLFRVPVQVDYLRLFLLFFLLLLRLRTRQQIADFILLGRSNVFGHHRGSPSSHGFLHGEGLSFASRGGDFLHRRLAFQCFGLLFLDRGDFHRIGLGNGLSFDFVLGEDFPAVDKQAFLDLGVLQQLLELELPFERLEIVAQKAHFPAQHGGDLGSQAGIFLQNQYFFLSKSIQGLESLLRRESFVADSIKKRPIGEFEQKLLLFSREESQQLFFLQFLELLQIKSRIGSIVELLDRLIPYHLLQQNHAQTEDIHDQRILEPLLFLVLEGLRTDWGVPLGRFIQELVVSLLHVIETVHDEVLLGDFVVEDVVLGEVSVDEIVLLKMGESSQNVVQKIESLLVGGEELTSLCEGRFWVFKEQPDDFAGGVWLVV